MTERERFEKLQALSLDFTAFIGKLEWAEVDGDTLGEFLKAKVALVRDLDRMADDLRDAEEA